VAGGEGVRGCLLFCQQGQVFYTGHTGPRRYPHSPIPQRIALFTRRSPLLPSPLPLGLEYESHAKCLAATHTQNVSVCGATVLGAGRAADDGRAVRQ
jgi:hypothetical protein